MDFSDIDLDYYSRQIVLPNFGKKGQKKFKQAKLAILGCGGLGANSSLLLAKMGIGYLRLVDRDRVEISNLHRTPLYACTDVGKNKAEIAKEELSRLTENTVIDARVTTLNSSTIEDLLDGIDIVIDGLDSIDTRLIVNSWCYKKKIPYLFAGALGYSVNLSTFIYTNDHSPCLACLFSGINYENMPGNDIAGIHPAVLSIAIAIQASELTRILIGQSPLLIGKMLIYDQITLSQDTIGFKKNPKCQICSKSSY